MDSFLIFMIVINKKQKQLKTTIKSDFFPEKMLNSRNINPIYTDHFISFFVPLQMIKFYQVEIYVKNGNMFRVKSLRLSGNQLKVKKKAYNSMKNLEDNRIRRSF